MKKIVLILGILFISVNLFALEINYRVVRDTESEDGTKIKENSVIKVDENTYVYNEYKDHYAFDTKYVILSVKNNDKSKHYYGYDLELLDNDKIFDYQSDKSLKQESYKFISDYYLDVLKERNTNIIYEKENRWKDIRDNKAYLYDNNFEGAFWPNVVWLDNIYVSLSIYECFLIQNIKKTNSTYYVTIHNPKNEFRTDEVPYPIPYLDHIEDDEIVFILEFDGDYVDIWINSKDEYVGKYFLSTTSTLKEIHNLFADNSLDLSKVYWPRHADGSSDFDNEIKEPLVKLAEPGHMSIKDFPEVLEERKRLEEEKKLEEQKRIEEENYVPTPEEQYELERQAAEDNVDNFDDFMEYNKKYNYDEYKKNLPEYIGYLFLTRVLPIIVILLFILLVIKKIKNKSKSKK